MLLQVKKDQLFKKQAVNRKESRYNKEYDQILDKIVQDRNIPTLMDMFADNAFVGKYGVVFHFEESDNGSNYRHSLCITPQELGAYKVVVLSAFDDFVDNYFDKLKTDLEFNKSFLKGVPDWLYLRYVLLVNQRDIKDNLIFGLIEQHSFMRNEGFKEINVQDHELDNNFISSFEGYKITDYIVPIKHVSFGLSRWLYISSPIFGNPHVANFGLIGKTISRFDKQARLYIATNFVTNASLSQGFNSGRSLPFITCGSNRLAILYTPLIQDVLEHIQLKQTDNYVRFDVKMGNKMFSQNAKVTSDLASCLHVNIDRLIDLIASVFKTDQNLEDREGKLFKRKSVSYGMMVQNKKHVTYELADLIDDFYYSDFNYNILFVLTKYNRILMSDLTRLTKEQTYIDDLAFKEQTFERSLVDKPLSNKRSGLETLFDLLGRGQKNILLCDKKAYDLQGSSSIKYIREVDLGNGN